MADKKIKDNNIATIDEFEKYLSEKAKNHKNYKYYSKSKYVKTILTTNAVFLSDGKNWNDKLDSDNFVKSDETCYKYALCLSYSKSESVAMWLLYSGNDGCMIDYNKKVIDCILNTEFISLGEFNGNVFVEKEKLNKKDFDIEIFDIVYYGETKKEFKDKYYVRRSDEINQKFSKNLIDTIDCKKKKLSWSYENECRIIVSFKADLTKEKYSSLKIELPTECKELILNSTYNSPNCKIGEYKESLLKKDLNWNLCKDCKTNNNSSN